jgi:hypothetical protein
MRDINIFSINSLTGEVGVSLNKGGEQIRGKEALMQMILINLLNDKGSNLYNLSKGSDIPGLIGETYGENEIDVIKTMIIMELTSIEQYILNEQRSTFSNNTDDLESRLKKLELISIEYKKETSSWEIKVLVRTMANTIGILSI